MRDAQHTQHPAAVARPHLRYSRVHEARIRAIAQARAAAGLWDDGSQLLRQEYLAYRITQHPHHTVLWNRNYKALWELVAEDGQRQWRPIMPWEIESHYERIEAAGCSQCGEIEPEGSRFFYGDSWCLPKPCGLGCGTVLQLVDHVEGQIRTIGLEPPVWFDHPCPADSFTSRLAGEVERREYAPPADMGVSLPDLHSEFDLSDAEVCLHVVQDLLRPGERKDSVDRQFVGSRLSEFVEFVRTQHAGDDPRGDFIRDTRAATQNAPITPLLARLVFDSMQGGSYAAYEEFDALVEEFRLSAQPVAG